MILEKINETFSKGYNIGIVSLRHLLPIENFYFKFILTVIAITLVVIAMELNNRNYYGAVEIINGSVRVNGAIDVSGDIDTYKQNNTLAQH